MVTTDEQLISLTHAIKSCPVINNSKESLAPEREPMSRRIMDNSGKWVLSQIGIQIQSKQTNKTVNFRGVIGCLCIYSTVTTTVATPISSYYLLDTCSMPDSF